MKIIDGQKEKADLTFIITVYNEEKYLPILFGSMKEQTSSINAEVLVIDDSSTDKSVELAKAFGARVITNDEKANVTKSRNTGLKEANGEVLIFVDADVAFSSNFVKEMVEPILEGETDITLCFNYQALESEFDILPQKYSKSYASFLKNAPSFLLRKSPVRVFPWIGGWIKRNLTQKGYTKLLSIPDRVHTTAIAVRASIPKSIGFHSSSKFGAHNDTEYCLNVFQKTDKTLWKMKPTLYISERRYFPEDASWIPMSIFKPIVKLLGIGRKKKSKKGGLNNPSGVR